MLKINFYILLILSTEAYASTPTDRTKTPEEQRTEERLLLIRTEGSESPRTKSTTGSPVTTTPQDNYVVMPDLRSPVHNPQMHEAHHQDHCTQTSILFGCFLSGSALVGIMIKTILF